MEYNIENFIIETAKDIYVKFDLKNNPPAICAKKSIEFAEILARELENQNYFKTSNIGG